MQFSSPFVNTTALYACGGIYLLLTHGLQERSSWKHDVEILPETKKQQLVIY
jgi:hypothetical protein